VAKRNPNPTPERAAPAPGARRTRPRRQRERGSQTEHDVGGPTFESRDRILLADSASVRSLASRLTTSMSSFHLDGVG
jgi:hypothetical protein